MTAASLEDRELYARLLAGDATATNDLAERFLAPVRNAVARKLAQLYPGVDPDLADEVTVQSILSLGERSWRFDPERLGLQAFLVMDAMGDARNALAKEQRRRARLAPAEAVEVRRNVRNMPTEEPEALLFREDVVTLPPGMSREDALTAIANAFPNERDRKALQLIGARERRTAAYARVFGIEHLDLEAQRSEVKRHKDRITVKRNRLLKKLAGSSQPPAGD